MVWWKGHWTQTCFASFTTKDGALEHTASVPTQQWDTVQATTLPASSEILYLYDLTSAFTTL